MARANSFDKGKAGVLVFVNTGYVKVSTFFDYLSKGKSIDAFLKDFPTGQPQSQHWRSLRR